MRVVHYITQMNIAAGGVVRAVMDLANAQASNGMQVVVATHHPADAPQAWREPRANPSLVDLGPAGRMPFFAASAVDRLRTTLDGASALHLHGLWEWPALAAGHVATKAGVPYFISPHGMLDRWSMQQSAAKKRVYLKLIGNRWLSKARGIACTAQLELEQASEWLTGDRGGVIPLPFDASEYEQLPGPELARERFPILKSGRPTVLFLSRLHPKKGVEVLVDAAAELKKRGAELTLMLAGPGDDGYVEAIRSRVAAAGLGETTEFCGLVTGADKVSLYEACELFVLPTSQENFGYVFYESLAAGTPLITTPGVDTASELESSGGAWIVDADPVRMADAIDERLRDRALLAEQGQRARSWALTALTAEKVAGDYATLYAHGPEGLRASRGGS